MKVTRNERKPKHYSIEEVLSKTIFAESRHKKAHKVQFDGEWINMSSHRYQCFAAYGVVCVDCGIQGEYFIMERQGIGSFHFSLYALDEDGNEILMTRDHILPRARGGKNELKNYQPMCCKCNEKKGCKIIPVYT